jgi:hypothetical protein
MNKYYLNEDKTYRPAGLMEWAEQFETMDRHVLDDKIDGHRVSTIWLGLDHNYFGGKPLVFETMIFVDEDGGNDIYCDRYSTWEEAEKGHMQALSWLMERLREQPNEGTSSVETAV